MEYSDPYYFLLLDNINIPSYSHLHEKSLDSAEFESTQCDFSTNMLSPNSHVSSSIEMSPQSTNSTLCYSSDPSPQLLTACFPSPTSSIIEARKPSPLLEPRTVKSHQINSYPVLGNENNFNTFYYHQQYPQQQQSILTSIDTTSRKKKKILGKKQKKINELPYAPNLLNLQLTPVLNSANQQYKRNVTKNQSSSTEEGRSVLSTTTKPSSPSPSSSSSSSSSSSLSSSSSSSYKAPSTYRCDFPDCEKTFTRPYNLKSHRRTHTAERPFDCPLCPKSFARQHDRNRHAKLHLGIKPYTCHFCNKSFARQDALNRHQRTTVNNSSPIPSCGRSIGGRRKTKGSLSSTTTTTSSFPFRHL